MTVLQAGPVRLALDSPCVMGVINVTPDSFSDGGLFQDTDAALRQARRMVAEGAAIIDVGGESTRPGAVPVNAQQEMDRVLPVIEAIVASLDIPVSIDTSRAEVMREAVAAGAVLINDVRALRRPGALEAAAELDAAVCLMHMQGEPETMQDAPRYGNVVGEVIDFLAKRTAACKAVGITGDRIVLDPGFGFGKTIRHNLALMAELHSVCELGYPVLAGLSRKSMLGTITGRPVDERRTGSAVLAALAAERGAKIIRAHDVAETVDALRIVDALLRGDAA